MENLDEKEEPGQKIGEDESSKVQSSSSFMTARGKPMTKPTDLTLELPKYREHDKESGRGGADRNPFSVAENNQGEDLTSLNNHMRVSHESIISEIVAPHGPSMTANMN